MEIAAAAPSDPRRVSFCAATRSFLTIAMNCLDSRRLLLTAPRRHAPEHWAHLTGCASCRKLARELQAFDRAIEDAALVQVPAGLVHRVMLARRSTA